MKKTLYRLSIAWYAVFLLFVIMGKLIPAITGNAWDRQSLDLFFAFAAGMLLLATSAIAADCCGLIRLTAILPKKRRPRDLTQAYILHHAEDLYRQQGYFNQGCFGAGHIAMQFGVQERDPLVQDALATLVENGDLVPHSDPKGTLYGLPPARQFDIIRRHDLPHRWEERGEHFLPNDPNLGEIARVKRAVGVKVNT